MSSDLPPRPSFEYLKKRAKELLRELQKTNPRAKLADAQHQIAREHGFLNWSQLKELVQSLANRPPEPPAQPKRGLCGRFTTRARQATFFSRFEAAQLGHLTIDPGHLLLGALRARSGLTSRVLEHARLSLDDIRAAIVAHRQAEAPLSNDVVIRFSEDTSRACQFAGAEADRLQHDDIGTAHLLLGLLLDEHSMAASILRDRGVTLDAIRSRIDDWIDEERAS